MYCDLENLKIMKILTIMIINNCQCNVVMILFVLGLFLDKKMVNMKLIYIRSTMEPKNYSTIRSILKKEQGEKIAPYFFKINDTQTLEAYLRKEKITYEIYHEERKIINIGKRKHHYYLIKSKNL